MCLREEWRGTSLNATARAALLGCGLALGRGLLSEIRALEVKFERAVAPAKGCCDICMDICVIVCVGGDVAETTLLGILNKPLTARGSCESDENVGPHV